jgi:iron-sulfur cluster assembly protein
MNLMVSPRAVDELKKAAESRREEQAPDTVRVLVQSQCGCGTAHFAMGFDEAQQDDNQIDLDGVKLVVDPFSAPFLEDAEMDYSDDLMGQGFRINAANGGGCGCGGHGHGHSH